MWAGIARSITPLRPAKAMPKPIVEPSEAAPRARRPAAPQKPVPQKPALQVKSPPLAPFERRLKQRVARGRSAIDVRIDLHGMTQRQAHTALLRFLRQAQADDARIALVVTGKGGGKSPDDLGERGVLRRQVPMWLALPEFRHFVVGFDEAHLSHGGQGALYVRLRRVR